MIVDNQHRARQSMKALLNAWYPDEKISEATNGVEAVQTSEEFMPHIILMDARMPGMNGIEATRQIKAKQPQIKIIVLSMYPEFEIEALSAGADAFVSKSDLPDKLRKTLIDVVDKDSRK